MFEDNSSLCSGAKGINHIISKIEVSKTLLPLFTLCLQFKCVSFNLIARHTPG